jgi:two-component system response regulator AtoC
MPSSDLSVVPELWPLGCFIEERVSLRFLGFMSTSLDRSFRVDPAELPGQAVIFGSTPAMREIRSRIDSVLSVDLPVLIQGESGTGKELIARFLHARSSRRDAPFVKLNCSAIPANLLESELFGSEKGSFKGVSEDRPGLIEIADGGTLFLNEIGDMSLDLQGKLHRLLRDRSYTRIGGREERLGHIRVICATNIDLQKAVELGTFREDLFYRINVVSLRPSPLRHRKSDIPQLCEYFLQKLSLQFRRNIPQLRPVTLQLLKQWDWPGNLRELENWIARAIILGDDEALSAELKRRLEAPNGLASPQFRLSSLKETTDRATSRVTSALILKALQANRWNRRKTAEELNMSYRALLYKLRDAGVGIPQRRRSHRGRPPAH